MCVVYSPWIFDVYSEEIRSTTASLCVDDRFLAACVPGTIRVVSAVSEHPEAVGAYFDGKWVYVTRHGEPTLSRITVAVAGVPQDVL